MMSRAPENRAAAPTPDIALPTINVVELGATAEMTDPTSKKNSAPMKTHFDEYRA